MLAAKADELDATIRKLSAMRDGLRHAAPARRRATWNARRSAGCWERRRPALSDGKKSAGPKPLRKVGA